MIVDGVEQLDAAAAARRVSEGAVMVDVREAEERAQARIPDSLWVPLSQLPQRFEELPRRPLVMHCAGGARSHQAAKFLQQKGFHAANLMHGLHGWYRMGQPLDTG